MIEIDIEDFDTWEDFTLMGKILEKNLNCRLLNRTEGPDARSWEFGFNRSRFFLVHDDIKGNFMSVTDKEEINKLKNIIDQLKLIMATYS